MIEQKMMGYIRSPPLTIRSITVLSPLIQIFPSYDNLYHTLKVKDDSLKERKCLFHERIDRIQGVKNEKPEIPISRELRYYLKKEKRRLGPSLCSDLLQHKNRV
jgi:hypothetical protein